MASISSLGVGSGIDIQSLVTGLVEAEGSAKSLRLNRKDAQFQAKLSALSAVKSALSDFQDTFSALKLTSTFSSYTASSTSTATFTATASSGAVLADYDVEVTQLAQSQKISSAAIADKSSLVGTGTLVFKFGTYTYDGAGAETGFTEDATNTNSGTEIAITGGSMEDIRDAINNADIGVTASIINVGTSGYKLTFSSETGEASALNVTVKAGTDSDGNEQDASGLSNFAYDPTNDSGAGAVTSMSYTQAAQDAMMVIEGLTVQKSSNTVSDVIENVTLNLKAADAGNTHSLSVGRNTSAIGEAVQGFVDGYNNLMALLNETTFYDSENGASGILIGDPTVRGIISQVRNVINSTVDDPTATYNSFASIGILTTRDGTFEYDASKLTAALSSNPDEVQFLLAGGSASTRDPDIEVVSVTNNIGEGIYGVNLTQVPTQGAYTAAAFNTGAIFDLAGVHSFQLDVDGISTNLLTLANSNYFTDNGNNATLAGQAMAVDLQNLVNSDANLVAAGASVNVNFIADSPTTGHFEIASNKYGNSSSLQITTSATGLSTNFNINVAAASSGQNGAGTIGGLAASFDGEVMTGSGLYAGFVLKVTGGAVGERLGISVTEGQMNKLNSLINSFLDSDGLIDSKTDGINASLDDISKQREDLAIRLESLESRLIKQFSAMDSLVAQLNSTSSFLSNQLDSLSSLANRNK